MFVAQKLYDNAEYRISEAIDIAKIVKDIIDYNDKQDQEKEFFFVFGLDIRNKIKFIDIVSIGTLTEVLVSPREIFKVAIMKNCVSIIVAHTHPSGEVEPSMEDIEITHKLTKGGNILEIKVLDHVIVGTNPRNKKLEYFSFNQKGLINTKN